MPNRVLRPWLDSEAVNSLTDQAEVFFVRLIQGADDFGRFHGSPMLLKSLLYPLKNKRAADMPRLVAACEKAGLIASYEVKGKRYIQILKFRQRLRKMKSDFPVPPPEILALCEDDKATDDKQLPDNRPTIDRQTTVNRPSNDRQTSDNCPPEEEVEDEAENKTDSDIKSSSVTPEPGNPGSPGRRNAEKAHLFFDYEGDSRIHGVTPELLAYWREMYPAIDVEAELKAASAWLDANRKNRKTDIKRFVVNWLKRTQDRAPRVHDQPKPQTTTNGWGI